MKLEMHMSHSTSAKRNILLWSHLYNKLTHLWTLGKNWLGDESSAWANVLHMFFHYSELGMNQFQPCCTRYIVWFILPVFFIQKFRFLINSWWRWMQAETWRRCCNPCGSGVQLKFDLLQFLVSFALWSFELSFSSIGCKSGWVIPMG